MNEIDHGRVLPLQDALTAVCNTACASPGEVLCALGRVVGYAIVACGAPGERTEALVALTALAQSSMAEADRVALATAPPAGGA